MEVQGAAVLGGGMPPIPTQHPTAPSASAAGPWLCGSRRRALTKGDILQISLKQRVVTKLSSETETECEEELLRRLLRTNSLSWSEALASLHLFVAWHSGVECGWDAGSPLTGLTVS